LLREYFRSDVPPFFDLVLLFSPDFSTLRNDIFHESRSSFLFLSFSPSLRALPDVPRASYDYLVRRPPGQFAPFLYHGIPFPHYTFAVDPPHLGITPLISFFSLCVAPELVPPTLRPSFCLILFSNLFFFQRHAVFALCVVYQNHQTHVILSCQLVPLSFSQSFSLFPFPSFLGEPTRHFFPATDVAVSFVSAFLPRLVWYPALLERFNAFTSPSMPLLSNIYQQRLFALPPEFF